MNKTNAFNTISNGKLPPIDRSATPGLLAGSLMIPLNQGNNLNVPGTAPLGLT